MSVSKQSFPTINMTTTGAPLLKENSTKTLLLGSKQLLLMLFSFLAAFCRSQYIFQPVGEQPVIYYIIAYTDICSRLRAVGVL